MLLFFLLAWVNFRASRGILERQTRAEARGTAEKTNQYLDLYVESVKSLFRYIATERVITADRLRELADMVPLVVETLYVLRDDGTVVCSRQVVYDLLGNTFAGPEFDPYGVGPTFDWTEPYASNLSGLTIAMLQRIPHGVVVAEINIELLREQIAGAAGRRDMALVITSADGRLILDDRASPFSYAAVRDAGFLHALSDAPYGASEFLWQGSARLIVKSRRNALGWNVHVLVDPAFMERELTVLYRNFRTIGVLLLAVLLISTLGLSLIITQPVRRLAATMDQVQSLNQVSPVPNTFTDELSDLVDSYNAMMYRINSLTYENNEYEWRMLQSQIGPHFLYNTLACISALAKRNRVDRVRLALDSLVELLRHSFGRQSSEVVLRDEIDMLEAYVRIQRIRYGDRFTLEVDCPAEASRTKVPALILQPIVENSIFYGFSDRSDTGTIHVSISRRGGSLTVIVRDDGAGMWPERLAEVRRTLHLQDDECGSDPFEEGAASTEAGDSTAPRDRLNAIGLRNIHRRLRVHYGPEYGLSIHSQPAAGTRVVIHLPAIDAE